MLKIIVYEIKNFRLENNLTFVKTVNPKCCQWIGTNFIALASKNLFQFQKAVNHSSIKMWIQGKGGG